jgi:hypothetical protein
MAVNKLFRKREHQQHVALQVVKIVIGNDVD